MVLLLEIFRHILKGNFEVRTFLRPWSGPVYTQIHLVVSDSLERHDRTGMATDRGCVGISATLGCSFPQRSHSVTREILACSFDALLSALPICWNAPRRAFFFLCRSSGQGRAHIWILENEKK